MTTLLLTRDTTTRSTVDAAVAWTLTQGEELGLYEELERIGPASAYDLAAAMSLPPRFVAFCLAVQAEAGYLHFEPTTGEYASCCPLQGRETTRGGRR